MDKPKILLACPFCGYDEPSSKVSNLGAVVECPVCGAQGGRNRNVSTAIEAWNERAGSGRVAQENGGERLAPASWLDALSENLRAETRVWATRTDRIPENTAWLVLHGLAQAIDRTKESASNLQ